MLQIGGVGVIVAFHWVTFYGSIKYSNVSVALTCFSATGFFTAFFEPLILKRRIVAAEILLGLLAIAGIGIIFGFNPRYKVGIIFGIISAMGSALFPIFNKTFVEKVESRTLGFYELGIGLLASTLLVPLYLLKFPAAYYLPTLSDWIWLIVLAVFCTVLSFDLQLNALKKISPFTANLTYNLEPVYGIILAFVFFGENRELNAWFFLGLALIITAVFLQMGRMRKMK
jgi:drug/metabolite transporter (DMT)-like permease